MSRRFRGADHDKAARSLARLASRAREVLELALASEASDPMLSAAWIVDVTALPGNTLEVRVAIDATDVDPDPSAGDDLALDAPIDLEPLPAVTRDAVEARVLELAPWLRSEVAGAVQRRRAPDLRIVFVDPDDDPFDGIDSTFGSDD